MWKYVTGLLCASLGTACVLSPTDGAERSSRREPINLSGTTSASRGMLQLEAWNHDAARWDLVRSFRGNERVATREPDLYYWFAPDLMLDDPYWVASGASCRDPGEARLRVQQFQDGELTQLVTFDDAGQDCFARELGEGTHGFYAGQECHTGNEIRLTAARQCVPVQATDPTPPEIEVHLGDQVTQTVVRGGEAARDATLQHSINRDAWRATVVARDPESGIRYASVTVFFDCDGDDNPEHWLYQNTPSIWRRPGEDADHTRSLSIPFDTSDLRDACGAASTPLVRVVAMATSNANRSLHAPVIRAHFRR